MKILRGEVVVPASPLQLPGIVVAADKHQGLVVAGGDGAISITEIQPAGKRPMSGYEYVNGYNPKLGEAFLV